MHFHTYAYMHLHKTHVSSTFTNLQPPTGRSFPDTHKKIQRMSQEAMEELKRGQELLKEVTQCPRSIDDKQLTFKEEIPLVNGHLLH